MDKELKKIHEHYRDNYFNEEIADQIKDKVHQELKNADAISPIKMRNYSIAKRISYSAAACILLFGLFLGSAFISPAMAEVASKIPFLNMIFDQKPINQVISEELEERGYEVDGVGYSVRKKTFHATVIGSEEYYNEVNGEIEKIIKEIVSSRGYDDFKVTLEKEKIDPIMIENDANNLIREQVNEIVMEELVPKLIEQGYKIQTNYLIVDGSPAANSDAITIDLTIADTETRKIEIENAMIEEVKKQGIQEEVKVKFHTIDVQAKETEMQWSTEVLPVIFEGMLNKKEYKTKGVGYSFKKGTMNIHITTKVEKSDKEAAALGKKIENAIQDFLQSEDLKDIVGDTPYKIVVRDKHDKEEIN